MADESAEVYATPATVQDFLALHALSQYADAFIDEGWDSLSQLLSLSEANLHVLITDTKMKSGHAVVYFKPTSSLNIDPHRLTGIPFAGESLNSKAVYRPDPETGSVDHIAVPCVWMCPSLRLTTLLCGIGCKLLSSGSLASPDTFRARHELCADASSIERYLFLVSGAT